MASKTLSRDSIVLGRTILLATDTLKMDCEGAFWVYDDNDKEWLFFLVTSLIDVMGPRDIYVNLDKALSNVLSQTEIDLTPIYLAGPNETFVRNLRERQQTGPVATMPIHVPASNTGAEAWIYRLTTPMSDLDAGRVRRRFSKQSRELAIA